MSDPKNWPAEFAFPNPSGVDGWSSYGLTKRELFAAVAMAALIFEDVVPMTAVPSQARIVADGLLKELEDNPK